MIGHVAMLEMVRGKTSTTGGPKSRSSSPVIRPKSVASRDERPAKRKSRSPSPTPKFGQTETLQRENIMRMRQQQQQQQLDRQNLENGFRPERMVKPSDRPTAKKSINPRKLCAAQAEILQEMLQDAAKPRQRSVTTLAAVDAGVVDSAPTVAGPEKSSTDHGTLNGTATLAPANDRNKDGLPPVSVKPVKKIKIDVEFEDSDEDDEENLGLKKVMENIDKDLNVVDEMRRGVISKRPDGPIAPINSSWLEFSCRDDVKRKEPDTHILSLMPFLVMVENGMGPTARSGSADEKIDEDAKADDGETAMAAATDDDVAVVEEPAKEKKKTADSAKEECPENVPEKKVCDNEAAEEETAKDESEVTAKDCLESSCNDDNDVAMLEDSHEEVERLDDTVVLDSSVSDQDPGAETSGRSEAADTKDETNHRDGEPSQPEETPGDSNVAEPKANSETAVERKAENGEVERGEEKEPKVVSAMKNREKSGISEIGDEVEVEAKALCVVDKPVPTSTDSGLKVHEEADVEVEPTEKMGADRSPTSRVETAEPLGKIHDDDAVVRLDDDDLVLDKKAVVRLDDDDLVLDKKAVVVDGREIKPVACNDEPKVVDVECEVPCPTKRKRMVGILDASEPLDKKVKVAETRDSSTQPMVDKVEGPLENVAKDEKDSYLNVDSETGDQKKKEKVYRLTKSELEMLVICKVTEFFSDADKSEIGALRRRCEQLEKLLGQARKKDALHQKQLTDLQIVIQRMQNSKRFPHPTKPIMRSVGLQVQLTRYIPADPTKLVSRVTSLGVQGNKSLMVSNVQAHHTIQGQQVVLPKQVAGGQLAFVTNLGAAGALSGTTTLVSKTPNTSHLGSTTTLTSPSKPRVPANSVIGSRSPISVMKSPSAPLGVSLLPPKSSGMPPGLVLAGTLSGPTSTTKVPLMPAATQQSALRTALDPPKMNATSNATPIPMRLVPNQAVARQLTPTPATSASTSSPSNANPARAMTVSMVGQPSVVASGVKIIDLTADEEDANAQLKGLQTAVGGTTGTLSMSASSANSFSNVAVASSALTTGSNTVTVLAPSTVSGVSNNQLITLSAAQPVATMVCGANTLTTSSSIRMTTPLRPGTSLVNSGPVRLAYLMPSTSMVTMMRPNQSVFVAPTAGVRPGQPGVRPNVPTFVLQRGAALVPLQQGQVTSLSNVRPGSIPPQLTRISTPNASVASLPTMGSAPSVRPLGASPTVTSAGIGAGSATVSSIPVTISYSRPIPTSTVQSNLNVKTVLPPPSVLKHPAPLPPQPSYNEAALVGRKALPPKPALKISKVSNGIVLSWNMSLNVSHAEIASYQLYAYQEGSSLPSTSLWKKVGDVKALPLPMACTLTQFMEGNKYYFAVRAIDVHHRVGPFSDPGSIALISTTSPSSKQPQVTKS